MSGEGDPVRIGGAGIDDVEKDSLARFDAERITEAECASVDGGDIVGRIHGAVIARIEVSVPVVQREEELLIVPGGVFARFDEENAELSGVEPLSEIAAGEGVGVIPAQA